MGSYIVLDVPASSRCRMHFDCCAASVRTWTVATLLQQSMSPELPCFNGAFVAHFNCSATLSIPA